MKKYPDDVIVLAKELISKAKEKDDIIEVRFEEYLLTIYPDSTTREILYQYDREVLLRRELDKY